MPPLPVAIQAAVAAAATVLVALLGATAWLMLRAAMRRRIAAWPGWQLVAFAAVGAIAWTVVKRAPLHFEVKIDGLLELIGWLAIALVAFVVLVLVPLAAAIAIVVWGMARRRGGDPTSSPPEQ